VAGDGHGAGLRGIRAPQEVRLPAFVRVAQRWPSPGRVDIRAEVHRQLGGPEIAGRIPKGGRVAVAVGSPGIAEIDTIAAAVVEALKRHGAAPFVFPAMGSHGGATADGQVEVLAALGVTEKRVGAPIVSSMDVVELGRLRDGSTVWWDRHAHAADAVVLIGRVKPHTLFRGPFESGLIKMAVIGAGKQRGAMSIHATGPQDLGPRLAEAWEIIRARTPLALGVAVVEDAYDVPVEIAVVPAGAFLEREPALLARARGLMARQELDRLIHGAGTEIVEARRLHAPPPSRCSRHRRIIRRADAPGRSPAWRIRPRAGRGRAGGRPQGSRRRRSGAPGWPSGCPGSPGRPRSR
jgi:hypothetical protein